MKLNEKTISKILSLKSEDKFNEKKITTAHFDDNNLTKISLNKISLENLQFLSLKRNNLIEISFIKKLNNLFYLNLSENPVKTKN